MVKSIWALLPALALALVVLFAQPPKERHLKIVGGRTVVSFFPSLLEANRLRLQVKATAAGDDATGENSSGFRIENSTLGFNLVDGHLSKFTGGLISHAGGFKLSLGSNTIDADQFMVSPSTTVNDALVLTVDTDREAIPAFDLVSPRVIYSVPDSLLSVANMDMLVSVQGAQRLGQPDLAGKIVGTISVLAKSRVIDGRGDIVLPPPPPTPYTNQIDVALSNMGSLTAVGRTGTYPNGLNGLSMSTTSCNVGVQNIPWNAPMQVQHPAIAMQMYRLLNGRFEEIGWSWMKHGFFATNSSGCGTCQNPGTGALLGPGCSDTYGVGNNGDRFYLGGRDEINAFTGVWTCTASWFANYVNDCVRRNDGSGLDAVAHRLIVADQDLGITGARYFYEAYYVNANEVDKYNQIGSREASTSWSGTAWTINTIDQGEVVGPAINRWGEMRSTATPRTDGDVIVAVQTTSLGGGMWHYEYAVYNHDLDRQVREFSIPVPVGATVQNAGFHDIDSDATNQWTSSVANGAITWTSPVFGSASANPLKFASIFNFRFDANVPPASSSASMTLFKPGTGNSLVAATKGPLVLSPVQSYSLVNGSLAGGNLQSLALSDDDRLSVSTVPEGARSGTGITASTYASSGTVTSITLGIESQTTLPAGASPTQSVYLWNWSTSAWELVDSRPATQTDSTAVIAVSGDPTRFVNGSTREISIRVLDTSSLGVTGNRWQIQIDQLGTHIN